MKPKLRDWEPLFIAFLDVMHNVRSLFQNVPPSSSHSVSTHSTPGWLRPFSAMFTHAVPRSFIPSHQIQQQQSTSGTSAETKIKISSGRASGPFEGMMARELEAARRNDENRKKFSRDSRIPSQQEINSSVQMQQQFTSATTASAASEATQTTTPHVYCGPFQRMTRELEAARQRYQNSSRAELLGAEVNFEAIIDRWEKLSDEFFGNIADFKNRKALIEYLIFLYDKEKYISNQFKEIASASDFQSLKNAINEFGHLVDGFEKAITFSQEMTTPNPEPEDSHSNANLNLGATTTQTPLTHEERRTVSLITAMHLMAALHNEPKEKESETESETEETEPFGDTDSFNGDEI